MISCLRNSRSVLLRRFKPAHAPATSPRYHQHIHTAPPRPRPSEVPKSTRGLFSRRITSYHRPYVSSSVHASDPWMPSLARPRYRILWKVATAVLLPYALYRAVTHEEIVPYTNRVHRVLPYPSSKPDPPDFGIDIIMKRHGHNVLDPSDPNTVRVRRIADDIICGVQRILLADDDDNNNNDNSSSLKDPGPILNASRNRQGMMSVVRSHTGHLRQLNWKVFVVRDKRVNAYSTCSGKIVVFTGLIDYLDTDADIATALAHEMGHVVARHSIEFHEIAEFFIPLLSRLLPFSRRNEIEADRIGIMLLAAAGFDPRLAHMFYHKQGVTEGDSPWNDYISSHPSFKTRWRLLSQDKVMEEALELYHRKIRARKGSN